MRRRGWLILLPLLVFAGGNANSYLVKIIADDDTLTEFEVKLSQPHIKKLGDGFAIFSLPDFGYRGEDGEPMLYGRVFGVAVRRGDEVKVEIESADWSDWVALKPAPVCSATVNRAEMGTGVKMKGYNIPRGGGAEIAYDAIWRGVRVVGVDVVPVEYVPGKGTRFAGKMRVKVIHKGGEGEIYDERLYHPEFGKLYRAFILNWDRTIPPHSRYYMSNLWDESVGAELLVVSFSDFDGVFEEYYDRKILFGMPTRVIYVDSIGDSYYEIKMALQDAYTRWDIPPVYVLLVGDADGDYTIPVSSTHWSDHDYACLEGSDEFADVFVGRMSVDNLTQLRTIIRKHLNYEYPQDTSDHWWARFVGVANLYDCHEPYGPDDSSYMATIQYGAQCCTDAGFEEVEMFSDCFGDTWDDVRPPVEAGCNIIHYRGDINTNPLSSSFYDVDNHGKCPIASIITCAHGRFSDGDYRMSESAVRAGTPDAPKGAVAFIGQSNISYNAVVRSSISRHIMEGLFEAGLNALGAAVMYGKNGMIDEFGWTDAARTEFYANAFLGSPELSVWTKPIDFGRTVVYSAPVVVGENVFWVNVYYSDGIPVENARVSIHIGDSMYYSLTDETGWAQLNFTVLLPTDTVIFVATGSNIYPFFDTLEVESATERFLAVCRDSIVEVSGNGDGIVNPGEIVALFPVVKNFGDETAHSVEGKVYFLEENDNVVIIDSMVYFGDIFPDSSVYSEDSIVFAVNNMADNGEYVRLGVLLVDEEGDTFESQIVPIVRVHRFNFDLDTLLIEDYPPYGDGDSRVESGEFVRIYPVFRNVSYVKAESAMVKIDFSGEGADYVNIFCDSSKFALSCYPESVMVFENIPQLSLEISPLLYEDTPLQLNLYLKIYGVTFADSDLFVYTISVNTEGVFNDWPIGPDGYGYYIYDHTDTLFGRAPVYSWVELKTLGTYLDEITNSDDGYQEILSPFPFRFYGEEYDTIIVYSNGFITPPQSTPWSGPGTGNPQAFPTDGGPRGVVAGLWADLAPHRTVGDIYSYYDEENHIFYIEYDTCEEYHHWGYTTFEYMIFDPDYYPTPTGDCEIVVNYKRLGFTYNTAIGIESPDESTGLTFMYDGEYGAFAADVSSEGAIKITTNPPEDSVRCLLWLVYYGELVYTTGDDTISPGDTVSMRFCIKNTGYTRAEGVQVMVLPSETVRSIRSGLWGDISPSGVVCEPDSPAVFSVSSSIPPDTVIELQAVFSSNGGLYMDTVAFYLPLGCISEVNSEEINVPEDRNLIKSYPNPFNDVVLIEISIPNISSSVSLGVYDIAGKRIKTLYNGNIKAGKHYFTLKGQDFPASGIYLVVLNVDGKLATVEKILFIK